MFMNIRKQRGLEILEYGVIAAIIVGVGAAAYIGLADKISGSTTKVGACVENPNAANCK